MLYFSNDTIAQGQLLKDVCDDFDLHHLISESIRGKYLLDLCLNDLDYCKEKCVSEITDHKLLKISFNVPMPTTNTIDRFVFITKQPIINA